MKRWMALVAIGLAGCGQEAGGDESAAPTTLSSGPRSTPAGAPAATKAALLAVPEDKDELQRLVDLGYTPHDDHMHPPGAKECPLMGGDMVQ